MITRRTRCRSEGGSAGDVNLFRKGVVQVGGLHLAVVILFSGITRWVLLRPDLWLWMLADVCSMH